MQASLSSRRFLFSIKSSASCWEAESSLNRDNSSREWESEAKFEIEMRNGGNFQGSETNSSLLFEFARNFFSSAQKDFFFCDLIYFVFSSARFFPRLDRAMRLETTERASGGEVFNENFTFDESIRFPPRKKRRKKKVEIELISHVAQKS